jgi:hypothetical protein
VSGVSHVRDIGEHPDLAEMRQRFDRVTSSGQAVAIDGLVLLAGGWLAISPWVIGFNATAPNVTVNNLILGVMIGVVALGLAVAPARMYRLSWAMAAIGAWVIVAPFVIQRSSSTAGIVWTNAVTGGITVLLGLGAAGLVMSARRLGPSGHR